MCLHARRAACCDWAGESEPNGEGSHSLETKHQDGFGGAPTERLSARKPLLVLAGSVSNTFNAVVITKT